MTSATGTSAAGLNGRRPLTRPGQAHNGKDAGGLAIGQPSAAAEKRITDGTAVESVTFTRRAARVRPKTQR